MNYFNQNFLISETPKSQNTNIALRNLHFCYIAKFTFIEI